MCLGQPSSAVRHSSIAQKIQPEHMRTLARHRPLFQRLFSNTACNACNVTRPYTSYPFHMRAQQSETRGCGSRASFPEYPMPVLPAGTPAALDLASRGLATGAEVLPAAGSGMMTPRSPPPSCPSIEPCPCASGCVRDELAVACQCGGACEATCSGAYPAGCRVRMGTEDLPYCEACTTALST